MNARQKGFHRDREILQAVEEYGILDTLQVWALFFRNMVSGRRKAQERLLKLHRKGKLEREKDLEGVYTYYTQKPGLMDHLSSLNWVRIWLAYTIHSWEQLHSFSYERDYGILRCDGFAAIKNTATGKFRFYFIEMDRGTNIFDKVQKYNRLYKDGNYSGWWWCKLADRFPPILVVTTTINRAEHIKQLIKEQNSAGLEFKVYLLDDIKREVYKASICAPLGLTISADSV